MSNGDEEALRALRQKLKDALEKSEALDKENLELRARNEFLTNTGEQLRAKLDEFSNIPSGFHKAELDIKKDEADLSARKKSLAISKQISLVGGYLSAKESKALEDVKALWERTKKGTETIKRVKRTVDGKPTDVDITVKVSDLSILLALANSAADIRYNPFNIPDWKSALERAEEKREKEKKSAAMAAARSKRGKS